MKRFFIILVFVGYLAVQPVSIVQGNGTTPKGARRFDIKTIDLPGRIQDVLFLDLNQDKRPDILITYTVRTAADKPIKRYLAVLFQKDKGFGKTSDQTWELDPLATALLLGDVVPVPGVEIVYLTSEAVKYYMLEGPACFATRAETLFRTDSFFTCPQADVLPILQTTLDLDRNGYDDLIIPQFGAYTIYFQKEPGGEFSPLRIPIASYKKIVKTAHNFLILSQSLPNLEIADINGDGWKDLIMFDQGAFTYYLQVQSNPSRRNDQRFPQEPSGRFRLKFLKDSLKPDELAASFINLEDINQDGKLDLVITALRGQLDDISRLTTRIYLFLARSDKVGLRPTYAETPDQIINLKGICPLVRLGDVNGDGKPDLVATAFKTSFASNLKKAILRYIRLKYYLYLFQEKSGRFSRVPDFEHKMNLPFELVGRGRKYFSHIYMAEDFDNDGRKDLVTISGPDKKRGKIEINCGRPRADLSNPNGVSFKKNAYLYYPVKIPQAVFLQDLNQDRKCDLILKYRSQISLFISRS